MKTKISSKVRSFTVLPLLAVGGAFSHLACTAEFETECPEGMVQNGGGDVDVACVPADQGGAAGAGGASGEGGQGGTVAGQGGQAGKGGGGAGAGGSGGSRVTVKGSVVRANDGKVFSGANIWINGKPVVSDAEGHFEVPDVTVPYQLAYKEALDNVPDGGYSFYENLSASELSLRLWAMSEPSFNASVTGTLTGSGVYPQPSGYDTQIVVVAETGRQVGSGAVNGAGGASSSEFKATLVWPVSLGNRTTVKLYAMQQKNSPAGGVESFTGYGFSAMSVSADDALVGQNIPLVEVPQRQVKIDVVKPAPEFDFAGNGIVVQLRPPMASPSALSYYLNKAALESSSSSVVVPSIVDWAVDMSINIGDPLHQFSSQWARDVANDVNKITVRPPQPAKIVSPADQTVLEYGQPLTWSAVENAVHVVRLSNHTLAYPVVRIYTMATSVALPELSAFGVSPPNKQYDMEVFSYGAFASIDEYVNVTAGGEAAYSAGNAHIFNTSSAHRSVALP